MWATKEDLVLRYGEEFVDKISTRNRFDSVNNVYFADQSEASRNEVINAALADAKGQLLFELNCCFNIESIKNLIDQGESFSIVKTHHIKMTIAILKGQGDCEECDACKKEFKDLCSCGAIVSDSGLKPRLISKISVTEYTSCIPKNNCCSCNGECNCD